MNVFNRDVKRLQRDRAAKLHNSSDYDYLKNEVARRLVDRLLDIKKEFPVTVDLGCGSGHIGKFLGERGKVQNLIQLEWNPSTLTRDIVDNHAQHPGEPVPATRTSWYGVADEEFIPLQPNSVDLVISALALHWVNDLPSCFAQIHKALKPDGCFIAALLGGETLQELRSSLALADMERLGGVRPHVSPFTRLADCGNLLSGAGFNLTTVDSDALTVPYPDMFTLIDHLQGMGEQNASVNRDLPMNRDSLLAAAAAYEALYVDEDGVLPATFEVLYLIGWKAHDSQPKPLQRGSAVKSLKELGLEK